MTVAEMIAELQQQPPDVPVVIEAYEQMTERGNRAYDPKVIECVQDGAGVLSVLIWGMLVRDVKTGS